MILLGLVAAVILVVIVAFFPNKEEQKQGVDEKVMIPTMTVENYGSNTGAKSISLTQSQYDEVYLIKTLRNITPVNRTYFYIDFDYKINKFVVKFKDTNKGSTEFSKWLSDTGYGGISQQYFQIQK